MAARVVGQRGHPDARAARAKSKCDSFAEPAPWQITTPARRLLVGHEQGVGQAVVEPSEGRGGAGVLHNRHSIMSRRLEQQAAPAGTGVSHVYPIGSRLDERGRLEVGGCDVFDVAAEFGTPAYVYSVEDIRTRARAYVEGFRKRTDHFEVVYASKAFPCTAATGCWPRRASPATSPRAASCTWPCAAGSRPEKIYFHGNNKSRAEIAYAQEAGVGHIVIDSFHEIDLIEAPQRVMLRVTPGIKPTTHDYIATGQVDSKFGFGLDDVPRGDRGGRRARARAGRPARAPGLADLRPRPVREARRGADADGRLPAAQPGRRPRHRLHRRTSEPPAIDDYVETLVGGAPEGVPVLCEPGRSLVGNAGVTLYTVGTVKEIPGVRTYVAVDGGMSDNLRPMLYGARYEAEIADRFGGGTVCTIAGKHCESGDVLQRDVR